MLCLHPDIGVILCWRIGISLATSRASAHEKDDKINGELLHEKLYSKQHEVFNERAGNCISEVYKQLAGEQIKNSIWLIDVNIKRSTFFGQFYLGI